VVGKVQAPKVLIGFSGGIASAVTAVLLKNQGYTVAAMQLIMQHGSEERFSCFSSSKSDKAKKLAEKIGILYYEQDASELFDEKVADYSLHELLQQRYPATCTQCYSEIVLHILEKQADQLGYPFIATGHYVRAVPDTGGIARLYKALDRKNDQSYHLFNLKQSLLKRFITPLGGVMSSMVQKIAEELKLEEIQTKPKSFCFLGTNSLNNFIEQRSPVILRPHGIIRTDEGHVVGEHQGLAEYRIGQHEGVHLTVDNKEPMFVIGFEPLHHALVVGPESKLFTKKAVAVEASWIKPINKLKGFVCKAKVSVEHEEAPCSVTLFQNSTIHVEFQELQRAITPGQPVVFYDEDEVIGGALISDTSIASND